MSAVSWQRWALGAEVAPAELAARRRRVRRRLCDLMFVGNHGRGCRHTRSDAAGVSRLDKVVGLRAGDRYLVAMPFFLLRLQGWLAGLPDDRRRVARACL